MTTYRAAITIANRGGAPLRLVVEPWGDVHELAPGAAVRAAAEASEPGEFEVEHGPDWVALYAWPTATLRLTDAAGALIPGGAYDQPVPPIPPGASVAGFLRTMFGG